MKFSNGGQHAVLWFKGAEELADLEHDGAGAQGGRQGDDLAGEVARLIEVTLCTWAIARSRRAIVGSMNALVDA